MIISNRNAWCAVVNRIVKMSSHESYLNLGGQKSVKHVHPAGERNKEPILQCLKKYVDGSQKSYFLEISSGSGQHVAYFAPNFPNTTFQPTEINESSLGSISAYVAENVDGNINEPEFLDVREPYETWLGGTLKPDSIDYILNVNMMHIAEWACTKGLFAGAGVLLKPEGLLFTYGPYAFDGKMTPESNLNFDITLRARNGAWGLRDIVRELQPYAEEHGIHLQHIHDLPANNNFLVWKKTKL